MIFEDISPANQPFTHVFRPLSLSWQAEKIRVIYGLGEYQFPAERAAFAAENQLAIQQILAGEMTQTLLFRHGEECLKLQIRPLGEGLSFAFLTPPANESCLEGETEQAALLTFLQSC